VSSISLATEDVLSEAVGLRLLAEPGCGLECGRTLRRNGAGYLRSRMPSWHEMARRGQPVLVITDLDRGHCPATLVAQWCGRSERPDSLLIRVAVREVESWLLADHDGMRRLLRSKSRLPAQPDRLTDPKQHLLMLARSARRDIREELIAAQGAIARQGVGYNARLSAFVATDWSPARASARSNSLKRTRWRLAEFAKRSRRR
jgi:hypothetical protein